MTKDDRGPLDLERRIDDLSNELQSVKSELATIKSKLKVIVKELDEKEQEIKNIQFFKIGTSA